MNSLREVLFMAALATEGRLSLYEPYKPIYFTVIKK